MNPYRTKGVRMPHWTIEVHIQVPYPTPEHNPATGEQVFALGTYVFEENGPAFDGLAEAEAFATRVRLSLLNAPMATTHIVEHEGDLRSWKPSGPRLVE
jgi:hypothetical protein